MGVILIIAILIAIALPAFNAVMRNARITTARTEMAALGTAIGEFKAEFGTNPPSYVSFVLSGGHLPPTTESILRKMFPQIALRDPTAPNAINPTLASALTDAGVMGHELRGSEALVFFLGGVRLSGTTDFELTGFSKNPTNPFTQRSGQSSRLGPFYEFDTGRLRARTAGEVPPSRVGNLVYVDKLPGQTVPLLFASDGNGSIAEQDVRATPKTASPGSLNDFFNDGFLPVNNGAFYPQDLAPATPNAIRYGLYKKTSGAPHATLGWVLVSPGFDGNYGRGGYYAESGKPFYDPPAVDPKSPFDADNLTNFTNKTLAE